MALAAALAEGVVVLDGGLATELDRAGHDLSDALWSARLLADGPEALVAAHLAYFHAGAQVAISGSYQASFAGFAARGIGRDEAGRLVVRSVELAREARQRARDGGVDRPLWVAASVGPYGATLADGSEYRGRYGLTHRELRDFHRPRLELLASAGPDVLALETVPDMAEAEVLLELLGDLDVPAWLSFTSDGLATRASEPLADAFALVRGIDAVIAVGVNCTSPEGLDEVAALALTASGGKPVVLYPNSGQDWDAAGRRWMGSGLPALSPVAGWVDAGARLVGGCCGTTPADIAALAASLGS